MINVTHEMRHALAVGDSLWNCACKDWLMREASVRQFYDSSIQRCRGAVPEQYLISNYYMNYIGKQLNLEPLRITSGKRYADALEFCIGDYALKHTANNALKHIRGLLDKHCDSAAIIGLCHKDFIKKEICFHKYWK